jgi:hypothetical protein
MQSSTGMYLRAVVMLTCLIAVPLAALFGNKLPELARKTLGDRWDRISSFLPGGGGETPPQNPPVYPPMANAFGPAPGVPQGPPFAQQGFAGASGPGGAPIPWGPAPSGAPGPGAFGRPAAPVASQPPEAVLASYTEPTNGPPGVPSTWQGPPASGQSLGLNSGPSPTRPLGMVAGQAPLVPVPSSSYSQGPGSSALPSPPSTDRFTQYQRRVRELGGVYSLLETWGDRGQVFRFYCKVAVAGSADCTRYFEAVDADPLVAMGTVVQQVEAWRSGSR